ncbi:adenylate/guanylate cyclase domain-containing protein [Inquilinus limosus]|uniref:adenylate/guanylate cyclase domain-containing protein n=1 Tax=Inquilinus limosus TaxID=171674 RepID=UPI003F1923A6
MATLDELLLEARLAELEAARSWSPRVVSRLEQLIRSGDDAAVFRVNPIKFAQQHHLTEPEAIDLFLHATAAGLFTMNWMVLCPTCSSIIENFGSLRTINANRFYCHFCLNSCEATLDDFIVIAFTIVPTIRPIVFHRPETLPAQQHLMYVSFSGPHLTCDVPPGSTSLSPRQIFEQCRRGADFLGPGASTTLEFIAGRSGRSILNGTEVNTGAHFLVSVSDEQSGGLQRLRIEFRNGRWETSGTRLASGPVVLELNNSSDRRLLWTVVEFPDAVPHCATILDFEPYLSAKRLLTTQTFRDLFRHELVKGTEGMSVRDITLMFTDLKGSTELYERIGDLNAFALVQEHFERLTAVSVGHNGAIVKTLGDAVMAAFMSPADGVSAALAMQAEIARFNDARGERDLILKVGLHRGAAIAVTLNERLDYFGQNVNIAARVEALAEGGEICMTREVHDAEGVDAILEPCSCLAVSARLKGVRETMPVWRVQGTRTRP